jgi:hypothetical protein
MTLKRVRLNKKHWKRQRTAVFENQFDWSKIKTCLYVGARKHQFYLRDVLDRHKVKISIMEIFPENVELMARDESLEVMQGDAIKDRYGRRKWDMVLFWNGPEHVEKKDLEKCFKNLEKMTRKVLVMGAPYGKRPQGVLYGNEHEIHASTLIAKDFRDHFEEVVLVGEKDHKWSQLIAIKRMG